VSRANSSTPVGTLNGPKQDISLQASGQMDKAVDYRKVVVAWRNGSRSSSTRSPGFYDSVENDKIATWLNDERAIVLAIQKQPTPIPSQWWMACGRKLPALRRRSAVCHAECDDGPVDFGAQASATSRKPS